jgi:hypothetical protein
MSCQRPARGNRMIARHVFGPVRLVRARKPSLDVDRILWKMGPVGPMIVLPPLMKASKALYLLKTLTLALHGRCNGRSLPAGITGTRRLLREPRQPAAGRVSAERRASPAAPTYAVRCAPLGALQAHNSRGLAAVTVNRRRGCEGRTRSWVSHLAPPRPRRSLRARALARTAPPSGRRTLA